MNDSRPFLFAKRDGWDCRVCGAVLDTDELERHARDHVADNDATIGDANRPPQARYFLRAYTDGPR